MAEDQRHVLFLCSVYSQLKGKFSWPVYRGVSVKERYCRLCNDPDDKTLLIMSKFIFPALKLGEGLTSEERLPKSVFLKACIY